jgi:exosortase N
MDNASSKSRIFIQRTIALIVGLLPVIAMVTFRWAYLSQSTPVVLALLALPVHIYLVPNQGQKGYKTALFILLLISTVLCVQFDSQLMLYLSGLLLLLVCLETFLGKGSYTLLAHLVLATPGFHYVLRSVSFPLRLYLSGSTADLLGVFKLPISYEGNVLYYDGFKLLIDQACAGLSMFHYAFLAALLLTTSRVKTLSSFLVVCAAVVFLSLVSNQVRIILLTLNYVEPTHWLHNAIGLVCFVIFQVLPFLWYPDLSRKISELKQRKIKAGHYTILLFTPLLLWAQVDLEKETRDNNHSLQFANFTQSENGIHVKTTDREIIYLKPPVSPLHSAHSPEICWRGSGYVFKKIDQIKIGSNEVKYAQLVKGDEILHTAWWFQSGKKRAGSDLTWRIKAILNQEKYYLVNLTSTSKEQLLESVKAFDMDLM